MLRAKGQHPGSHLAALEGSEGMWIPPLGVQASPTPSERRMRGQVPFLARVPRELSEDRNILYRHTWDLPLLRALPRGLACPRGLRKVPGVDQEGPFATSRSEFPNSF